LTSNPSCGIASSAVFSVKYDHQMKYVAFVGTSDSGKTQLIQKVVGELKNRGHAVAVIKHCPHGFDLEPQGKDTARLVAAGADYACMVSADGSAVLQQKRPGLDVRKLSRKHLAGCDFVLVEGFRSDKTLRKIEVLRKGTTEKPSVPKEELIAVVADFETGKGIPSFHPEDAAKIADFLEGPDLETGPQLRLDIDDVAVPMNSFVQRIFMNTLWGMIQSLEQIPENPKSITLSWEKNQKKDKV